MPSGSACAHRIARCRWPPVASRDGRSGARHPVPTLVRRVPFGPVAVLQRVPRAAASDRAALVRTLWQPDRRAAGDVSGLSATVVDVDAIGVRLRRSGTARGAAVEVFGVARRGACIRRCDRRRAGGRRCRCRHVDTAGARATCGARVRSGARSGRRHRSPHRASRTTAAPPSHLDGAPGATFGRRTADGDARGFPCEPARTAARLARRRRPHHGRDARGRGRCPAGGRRRGGPRGHGGALHRAAPARVAPPGTDCLSSGGLSSGSVVARGSSPVVDASRGRNDPRKATVGG
jgi:hypothetical protein